MLMCYSNSYITCSTPAAFSFTNNNKKQQHVLSCYPTNLRRTHYRRNNPKMMMVTAPPYQPVDVDYLETRFGCDGVTFTGIGDSCIIKMGLENGSMVTVMLPTGLITSYKAPMWHGGTLEVLHTSVSQVRGNPVIQGGVSLDFTFQNTIEDGLSWSPTTWDLHHVQTTSATDTDDNNNSVKVELISTDMSVQVKHIITLEEDSLSSEIAVTNNNSISSSPIQFSGSVISHLTVSTPDATYAIGLERSDFITKPPLVSNFAILGSSSSTLEEMEEEEEEGEEDDNYKHLTEQMSVIYTSAPRNFTIIDRGRRNSVMIGREGFEEVYMLSPGSNQDRYTKYDYICIGACAVLKPLIVPPQHSWRGVLHLHNPNL